MYQVTCINVVVDALLLSSKKYQFKCEALVQGQSIIRKMPVFEPVAHLRDTAHKS